MKTLIALAFLLLSAVDGKNTTAFPVIGDVVPIVHMLTLCSFTLTLTVVVRSLVIYYNCPVPSVIIIYAVGVLIGFAMEFTDVFIAYEDVIYDLDSNMLLNSVLPLMVFKVAFCLDAHTFVRAWLQIVLVAIPGVLITAFIVGLVEMAILNLELHWTLLMGLIFGIVATPIYPFEVVKVLKEVEKSKHLSILLEGESMLGTGFCIVLFHIVLGAYRQNITDWYQFVFVFVRLCGGGIILGLIVGKISSMVVGKLYTDPLCMMGLTVVSTCLTFVASIDWFSVSGAMSCVVLGIMLSMEKKSLSSEVETFLTTNWELIVEFIDASLFFVFGCLTVPIFHHHSHYADYGLILMTYTLVMAARFTAYILLAPFLSRVGYGLTFRYTTIAVWGGVKGGMTYCMMLIVYTHPDFMALRREIALHMLGLVMLTLLLNATTMPFLLKLMGMFDLSMARQVNMNNCVRFVLDRRERTISMLKMDRFLADANWPTVHDATVFSHPYKTSNENADGSNEEEYFLGGHFAKCPECQREVQAEPTQKEMREMIREARLRVLKAKKISYARQYENGLITKDAFRIMNQCIEAAMDTEEVVVDIESLLKLFKRQKFANYLRKKIFYLFCFKKQMEIKVPRRRWRKFCYRIVMHKAFEFFIYTVIILSIPPILVEFIHPPPPRSILIYLLKSISLLLFFIYLIEFILKICALSFIYLKDGFKAYFKSYWNVLDFVVLFAATVGLVLDCIEVVDPELDLDVLMFDDIILSIRLGRVLRLLRLLKLCKSLYIKLIKFIDSKIDTKTGYAYDIGKGFVTGSDEVGDMLVQMIDNSEIRTDMRRRMEADRLCIMRELGLMQREKPQITVTVKSKQAIMAVINSMSEAIYELKSSGWVDDVEYRKLMDSLDVRLRFVRTINVVEPCTPKMIFEEVPWMCNNVDLIDFLYSKVNTKIFDPGDKVCEEGEMSEGIFILVTGLLKLRYSPNQAAKDSAFHFGGALPIIDYIGCSKYDDVYEDYIVSGNSIGELCTLTGRPYDCTIVAEIPSQAFLLTHEAMRAAMDKYNDPTQGLAAKIWKFVSIRLTTAILMEVPAYQSIRQEKIKYTLERSFVPDLSSFRVFAVNDMMEDIVLLEGIAMDYNTRDAYLAPCYIPRTVQKIALFNKNSLETSEKRLDTKLLIIPMVDVEDYEIMELGVEMSEMKSMSSLRCLQHGMQKRKKRKRRKKTMFNIANKHLENSELSIYYNKNQKDTENSIQTEGTTSIYTEIIYSADEHNYAMTPEIKLSASTDVILDDFSQSSSKPLKTKNDEEHSSESQIKTKPKELMKRTNKSFDSIKSTQSKRNKKLDKVDGSVHSKIESINEEKLSSESQLKAKPKEPMKGTNKSFDSIKSTQLKRTKKLDTEEGSVHSKKESITEEKLSSESQLKGKPKEPSKGTNKSFDSIKSAQLKRTKNLEKEDGSMHSKKESEIELKATSKELTRETKESFHSMESTKSNRKEKVGKEEGNLYPIQETIKEELSSASGFKLKPKDLTKETMKIHDSTEFIRSKKNEVEDEKMEPEATNEDKLSSESQVKTKSKEPIEEINTSLASTQAITSKANSNEEKTSSQSQANVQPRELLRGTKKTCDGTECAKSKTKKCRTICPKKEFVKEQLSSAGEFKPNEFTEEIGTSFNSMKSTKSTRKEKVGKKEGKMYPKEESIKEEPSSASAFKMKPKEFTEGTKTSFNSTESTKSKRKQKVGKEEGKMSPKQESIKEEPSSGSAFTIKPKEFTKGTIQLHESTELIKSKTNEKDDMKDEKSHLKAEATEEEKLSSGSQLKTKPDELMKRTRNSLDSTELRKSKRRDKDDGNFFLRPEAAHEQKLSIENQLHPKPETDEGKK